MYVVLTNSCFFVLLPCWHAQGEEPISSRFPHDGKERSVDFQWFASSSLESVGVLKLVSASHIEGGVPNTTFPSDHLSTKGVFAFK